MEEMPRTRYGKRAQSFHALWEHCSPQICICSPTWKLSFVILTEVSLYRYDWLNHWLLVTELNLWPLFPPQRSEGWDWDFQPSNHMVISMLRHFQKSPSLRNKKYRYFFIRKISKGFRSFVPEMGTNIKYIFIINHNITVVVLGGDSNWLDW